MKFLVVPDSFKGALGSAEAVDAIRAGILAGAPDAEVQGFAVADGGEGTVRALVASAESGELVTHEVTGPGWNKVTAEFGTLDETTAVVELAAAAGLTLMGDDLDVEHSTTYGVGEQILAAIDRGAHTVLIGAGGSATNDLGCGAAAALGVRFFNDRGERFIPVGSTLSEVHRIDVSGVLERVRQANLVIMTDVNNPLVGEQGCAAVFGPQKGADQQVVDRLDRAAQHLAGLWSQQLDADITELPGAGAAGGFAGGLHAMLGASLKSGIDTVLDAIDFENKIADVDAVFTAEGQIDGQSLSGKVPIGIARRAGDTPVIVLAGAVGDDIEAVYDHGVNAVIAVGQKPQTLPEALEDTAANLRATAENLTRLMVCVRDR